MIRLILSLQIAITGAIVVPAGAVPVTLIKFFDFRRPFCEGDLASARPHVILDRLVLRRAYGRDKARVCALLNEPDVARYYLADELRDDRARRDFFESQIRTAFRKPIIRRHGRTRKFRFVVESSVSGEVIGLGMVQRSFDYSGRWEIGYAIAPAQRRRGFAKEVITGLVDLAREIDPGAIVEATPDVANEASRAVLRSLDFVEGNPTDRDHTVWFKAGSRTADAPR